MHTYISILRGINVSGKNIIKMVVLKQLFETMGYKNVETYIQSGNVIFSAEEKNIKNLEFSIKDQINNKFGYDIKVLVLTPEKLNRIIKALPFKNIDTSKLSVTFLADKCSNPPINQILEKKSNSELIHIAEEAVYIYCPEGYGRTKLSNNFLEKKLNIDATTRNWKTVNRLLELAT